MGFWMYVHRTFCSRLPGKVNMFGRLLAAVICAASLSAMGQTASSNYQRGTITAVTVHQNAPGESSRDVVRYDVSVKVGNTNYVVLFTPPNGCLLYTSPSPR